MPRLKGHAPVEGGDCAGHGEASIADRRPSQRKMTRTAIGRSNDFDLPPKK